VYWVPIIHGRWCIEDVGLRSMLGAESVGDVIAAMVAVIAIVVKERYHKLCMLEWRLSVATHYFIKVARTTRSLGWR